MTDPRPIKNIYWNGGGFTGMVRSIAVLEHIEREKLEVETKYDFDNLQHYGVSGGAGFALLTVLGYTADEQMDVFFSRARIHDRGGMSFQESLSRIITKLLEIALCNETDESVREKCNGKLHIGYATPNGTLEFISQFNTREDVKRAILYTSNIPGAIIHKTEFGDGIRMDGGMLLVDPATMTRYGMTEDNTLVITSQIPVPWSLIEWSKETYMMWYAYNSAMIRVNGLESPGFGYDATENLVRKRGLVPVMTMIHMMTTKSSTWNDWLDKKLFQERK